MDNILDKMKRRREELAARATPVVAPTSERAVLTPTPNPVEAPIEPVVLPNPSDPIEPISDVEPDPTEPVEPKAPAPKTLEEMKEDIVNARNTYFNFKNNPPNTGRNLVPGIAADYPEKLLAAEAYYKKTKNELVRNLLEKGMSGAIEVREFLLSEVELKRKNDLENGHAGKGERIVAGISKGIEKWDKFGTGTGFKAFSQKMMKTVASLAMIGVVSGGIVEGFSKINIGTASALSGGIAKYMTQRLGMGLGMAAALDKVPGKYKKLASVAIMGGLTALTGGSLVFAGAGLVTASAIGLQVARMTKKYDKNNADSMRKVKLGEINLASLETNVEKMERDMEDALKAAEKSRMAGKIKELVVGSAVSALVMEAMDIEHHIFSHDTAPLVNKNNINPQNKDPINPTSPINNAQNTGPVNTTATTTNLNTAPSSAVTSEAPAHLGAVSQDALVHQGEGIENSFIRQIENNPQLAHDLGFTETPDQLHAFAQNHAHDLAIKEGYFDPKTGYEVKVSAADKIAFEIKMDGGHPVVTERLADGTVLETHHEGDAFPEKGNIQNPKYWDSGDHPSSGSSPHQTPSGPSFWKDTHHRSEIDFGKHTPIPRAPYAEKEELPMGKFNYEVTKEPPHITTQQEVKHGDIFTSTKVEQHIPTATEIARTKAEAAFAFDGTKVTSHEAGRSNMIWQTPIGNGMTPAYGVNPLNEHALILQNKAPMGPGYGAGVYIQPGGASGSIGSGAGGGNIGSGSGIVSSHDYIDVKGSGHITIAGLRTEEVEFIRTHPAFLAGNEFKLTGEQLIQARDIYEHSINHEFQGNDITKWMEAKGVEAKEFLHNDRYVKDPYYKSTLDFIHKLEKITEGQVHPERGLNHQESLESYEGRMFQWVIKHGMEHKVEDMEGIKLEKAA